MPRLARRTIAAADYSCRKTSTVRSTILSIEKLSTILCRGLFGSCLPRPRIACSIACASAVGDDGGTTVPLSPTINAESPTSVTMHGTPHAIASAMALEKPSVIEGEQETSKAFSAAAGSSSPVNCTRSAMPRLFASRCRASNCGPDPTQRKRARGARGASSAAARRNIAEHRVNAEPGPQPRERSDRCGDGVLGADPVVADEIAGKDNDIRSQRVHLLDDRRDPRRRHVRPMGMNIREKHDSGRRSAGGIIGNVNSQPAHDGRCRRVAVAERDEHNRCNQKNHDCRDRRTTPQV